MPVIAIIGAGPGLGVEIARAFGAKGFTVALIARNATKLDLLATELQDEGIEAKSGTILVTNGAGAIDPVPFLADINIAAAGLRNWTLNLHKELSQHGIYVAHVAISAWIGGGHPDAEAGVIAAAYPKLHETRTEPELHYIALDE